MSRLTVTPVALTSRRAFSFESARLLLSCFTNLMRSTAPSFQPMLLAFYRLHTLTLRLFLK
jgi:hypothetical protein